MGRRSQEDKICRLILDQLYNRKEKRGITFNALFNKVKKIRGKFSYDTLSKYLTKMEEDGRVIRIVDLESNRKIKPTLLFKNSKIIELRNQKINFGNILMDTNTEFYQFQKESLKKADLLPEFNALFLNFLRTQMNLNIDHLKNEEIINWENLLEGLNLFLIENPRIKGTAEKFNEILLNFYHAILELVLNLKNLNLIELNYNIFFQINLAEIFASFLLNLANKVYVGKLPLNNLFLERIKLPKTAEVTEANILKLLLNQLDNEIKDKIKDVIQKKRLEDFSEKYKKSLEII